MTLDTLVTINRIMMEAFDALRNHNVAAEAPYHNNAHMLGVHAICEELWELEKKESTITAVRPEVVLLMAALFHDFNHSAGTASDTENIERAVQALSDFSIDLIGAGATIEEVEAAEQAIRCTVFPFTQEPRNLMEQILRDADFLYTSYLGTPEDVMEGLRAEISIARGAEVSYQDMLAGQTAFMKSAKLYTPSAQVLWDLHVPRYMESLAEYVEQRTMTQKTE